jgi:hypothetical protein
MDLIQDLDSRFLNSNAVYNYIILANEGPGNPLSITQLVHFIHSTARYFGFQNWQLTEHDIISVLPGLGQSTDYLLFHYVYFILSHVFNTLNAMSGDDFNIIKIFNNEFNQDLFKDVWRPSDLEQQRWHSKKDTEPQKYREWLETTNAETTAAKAEALRKRRMEILNAGNNGAGKKRKSRKSRKTRKSRKSRKA